MDIFLLCARNDIKHDEFSFPPYSQQLTWTIYHIVIKYIYSKVHSYIMCTANEVKSVSYII